MPNDAPPLDRASAWTAALLAAPGELDLAISASSIEGEIPGSLRGGRHLQNGPGWTKVGDQVAHPFDGHGLLRELRLQEDGSVRLRSRFVQTPAYVAEAKAGRLVHRGLATNPSRNPLKNVLSPGPRNVANTTVVPWAGRLLCGWEGGRPYALDPATLETRGEETFGGALPEQAFLAHMRVDAIQRRLVGVNVALGMPTTFTFREFDEAGRQVATATAQVPGLRFVHDFVVTPRWYVVAGNPLKPKLAEFAKAKLGFGTLLGSIAPDLSAPGTFVLVPRGRPGPMRLVTLPRRAFVVHFVNAHDVDATTLAIDYTGFETFTFGNEFGYQAPDLPLDPALPDARVPQRAWRATVTDASDVATATSLSTYGLDFPRVHPDREGLPVKAFFAATRADTAHSDPFDSLARLDLDDPARPPDLWTAPDGCFVGEPLFVPDRASSSETAGHVVALVSDPARSASFLCVFDASSLSAGPVARVRLPLLPYGFHGAFESRADT